MKKISVTILFFFVITFALVAKSVVIVQDGDSVLNQSVDEENGELKRKRD